MDCEHRDQLLDLVYGELEDAEAIVLRRRAEACDGCRDELARLDDAKRLADQLVIEPMPLTAHNVIMAAAREAAQKKASAAEQQAEPGGFWVGALQWIREALAAPQLAMAVVMLGVVAVGIYFVPGDELAQQEIQQDLVATPDTELLPDEPDPQLAEPALDEDPIEAERLQEITEDTDEALPPRETEPETEPQPETDTTRPSMRPAPIRNTERTTRQRPSPAIQTRAAMEANGVPLAEGLNLESLRTEESIEGSIVDVAPRTPSQNQTRRTVAPEREEVGEAEAAQRPSTNTIEPMRGNRAAYDRAMSEYRGGDYRAAAQEFERVVQSPNDDVRQLLPSALHHLARSHRQRGACQTAVRHFARLFERYAAYQQVPQALIEAADCHRRLGNLRQARTLLYRAAGYSSTEAAARRELTRIENIQRAQRRSPAPAQADSLESAY